MRRSQMVAGFVLASGFLLGWASAPILVRHCRVRVSLSDVQVWQPELPAVVATSGARQARVLQLA